MRVDVLIPDSPASAPSRTALATGGANDAFARLVDAAGSILTGAERAEHAFAAHHGGLMEMVVERARADIALQVAASAAQRAAQSISTVLGMQI